MLLALLAEPADARAPALRARFGPQASGSTRHVAVPLPAPRPAEAPGRQDPPVDPGSQQIAKPAPPAASPCRQALTEEIAIAPSIPPIHGPGSCGGDDLVRLEAVVLPDHRRVALKPAATLRCTMAAALAEWVRSDMAPFAATLGTVLSDLDNFDSFDCRGRNRVSGAKLSEHGRANALDIRALKFANGQSLSLTDRNAPRSQRETVLRSVCARFTTVLAERRSGYRICQWDIHDPMPAVAPLLPAARPEQAPPRDVAAKPEAAPAASEYAAEPEAGEERPAPKPRPIQKRRGAGAF
jgi:hypothetical protein